MKVKLTDTFIRGLPDVDRQIEYYDSIVSGLVLRQTKSGGKSFALRYWFAGQSRQCTIGRYGDWELAQARRKARSMKQGLADGTDPLDERRQTIQNQQKKKAEQVLFAELVDQYRKAKMHRHRPATRQEYERIIEKELLPILGRLPVKEITPGHITKILDKKAYSQKSPVMANRIRSRLHTIFQFGIGRCIDENPVESTPRYDGERIGERTYSDEEIRRLWEYFGSMRSPCGVYFKILLLTGQRRSETLNMRWQDIQKINDNEVSGWVWNIQAELSKSDRSHEVFLSPTALEVIMKLGQSENNPHVFASHHDNEKPLALSTVKRAARDIQDHCISDFRMHDLRRTVSTKMAKIGVLQPVVEKLLNHKTSSAGPLAKVYNQYQYRPERQRALMLWANELNKIITGETEKIHKIGS